MCGSWFEETRRTEKEVRGFIEIDYLKRKYLLGCPRNEAKDRTRGRKAKPLKVNVGRDVHEGGGSVDPAESKDRGQEGRMQEEERERDERKERRPRTDTKQQQLRIKIQTTTLMAISHTRTTFRTGARDPKYS